MAAGAGHDDDDGAAIAARPPSSSGGGGGGGGGGDFMVIAIAVVVAVLIMVAVGAAYYYNAKKKDRERRSRPPARSRSGGLCRRRAICRRCRLALGADVLAGLRWKSAGPQRPRWPSGTAAHAALGVEIDILGPLSGVLTALPAVAPPPLNMCLMPFAHALAELGLAVRQVRFNKEAAALLQRRGTEIAQKLQDVVKATQGLPTGQVEAVARTVTAIGQALDEAAKFLQQFSQKGVLEALLRLARRAARRAPRQAALQLSTELGSALDLQQLALQAQRFEKIEGLIQLLSQQTIDANNQAARSGRRSCAAWRRAAPSSTRSSRRSGSNWTGSPRT